MRSRPHYVFVFDLDGTIVFDNEPIEPIVTTTLEYLIELGHVVVFATSRARRGVKAVLTPNLLRQPIIYCNGAFAESAGDPVVSCRLEKSTYDGILALLDHASTAYLVEYGDAFYYSPAAASLPLAVMLQAEAPQERLPQPLDTPPFKIALLGADSRLELTPSIASSVTLRRHESGAVDIMARGCSKWNALESLRARCESQTTVIAFGNDHNDEELLANADFSIVVGNACPDLTRYADAHIQPAKPESVRRFLDELVSQLADQSGERQTREGE